MHAFFLDIDGTFYDAQGVILDADREAILAARARGDKVFINTARPLSGLPKEITAMPFDGFVCSCGQVLAVNGQVLYNRFIPHELIEKSLALIDEFDACGVYYNCRERKTYRDENGVKSADELTDINQFYVSVSVSEEIDRRFGEYFFVHYARENATRIRCMMPGVNKANGIRLCEELLAIRHEDTVAIGDYDDDISMIRYARVGITLADALPETVAAADFVTKPLTEAGTGYALMHPELWENVKKKDG